MIKKVRDIIKTKNKAIKEVTSIHKHIDKEVVKHKKEGYSNKFEKQ